MNPAIPYVLHFGTNGKVVITDNFRPDTILIQTEGKTDQGESVSERVTLSKSGLLAITEEDLVRDAADNELVELWMSSFLQVEDGDDPTQFQLVMAGMAAPLINTLTMIEQTSRTVIFLTIVTELVLGSFRPPTQELTFNENLIKFELNGKKKSKSIPTTEEQWDNFSLDKLLS